MSEIGFNTDTNPESGSVLEMGIYENVKMTKAEFVELPSIKKLSCRFEDESGSYAVLDILEPDKNWKNYEDAAQKTNKNLAHLFDAYMERDKAYKVTKDYTSSWGVYFKRCAEVFTKKFINGDHNPNVRIKVTLDKNGYSKVHGFIPFIEGANVVDSKLKITESDRNFADKARNSRPNVGGNGKSDPLNEGYEMGMAIESQEEDDLGNI